MLRLSLSENQSNFLGFLNLKNGKTFAICKTYIEMLHKVLILIGTENKAKMAES